MNRKYFITDDDLKFFAQQSSSVAEVCRRLGRNDGGGTNHWVSRRLKKANIDTSHFTGQAYKREKISPNKLSWQQILIIRPNATNRNRAAQLRRAMLESGIVYECLCGNKGEWNGKRIVLEIDHINGDWSDDRKENLRFLCPNCHSQQPTTVAIVKK